MRVALLVNNLGGLSVLEANAFLHTVVRLLHATRPTTPLPKIPGLSPPHNLGNTTPVIVTHVVCAPMVTSLDMKGISVSLIPLSFPGGDLIPLPVSEDCTLRTLNQAFCAPTTCPHWPVVTLAAPSGTDSSANGDAMRVTFAPDTYHPPSEDEVIVPITNAGPNAGALGVAVPLDTLVSAAKAMHNAIKDAEDMISQLDKVAGDGDAGFTHVQIFRAIEEYVDSLTEKFQTATPGTTPMLPLASVLTNLANAVSHGAGGTSGVLYAIGLQAAANTVASASSSTSGTHVPIRILAEAFDGAIAECSRLGGAEEGHRTLLDALIPASRVLAQHVETPASDIGLGVKVVRAALLEASKKATEGAENTATMAPQVGRASYVQSNVAMGHKDPGAVAVSVWLNALANAV